MLGRYAQASGCLFGALLWAGTAGAVPVLSPFTTGPSNSDLGYLNTVGGIAFSNGAPGTGAFTDIYTLTNTGGFPGDPGPYGPGNTLTTTIALAAPPAATIADLFVSWYQGAVLPINLIGQEQVTDAAGNPIGPGPGGDGELVVTVVPLDTYSLVLSGHAQSFLASYSGSLTPTTRQANSLPLPAGFILFGTVLGGAGMLMRRRRKATPALAI